MTDKLKPNALGEYFGNLNIQNAKHGAGIQDLSILSNAM